MARVNVGINPKYLADQHLIAESVEITMITGGLRKHNYQIKSDIPSIFVFGKGHINFFKNKLLYLAHRLEEVNKEMHSRGFRASTQIDDIISEAPASLINDWKPTERDTKVIRERISSRLHTRVKGQPGQGYYRFNRELISDIDAFIAKFNQSELFHV
jgi:deoxyribonuclease (pyrimidine dimer)